MSKAEIYYANPRSFNDPLDCDPTIHVDIDLPDLEKLCSRFIAVADGAEKAKRAIGVHQYMSTEYGDYKTNKNAQKYYIQRLAFEIKNRLDAEMGARGVFSLAERWNCPLMWSHYADEHRGICIEYDMADHDCTYIKPVDYRRPRSIKTSDLVQWKFHKSAEAEEQVFDTYFFAKSPQWRYEREWRDIHSSNGVMPAPFRISSVYFGLRCDAAVQTSIVKLFSNSDVSPFFYDVYPLKDSFRLKRMPSDTAEIEAMGVQTPMYMYFRDVILDEKDA